MQVYKLFFRILNRHKHTLLVYVGIFMAIALIVSSQSSKNEDKQYKDQNFEFAFFDYDNTDTSRGVLRYLKENNKELKLDADEKEIIQDELYARNISCAIRIPKGFEEAVKKGEVGEWIEVDSIPNMSNAITMQTQLNGYMQLLCAYVAGGLDMKTASESAYGAATMETDIQLLGDGGSESASNMFYFFVECCYVFVAMMIVAVGPILILMAGKEVRARIRCSSYPFSSINRELFFGILTVGAGCCFVFFCLAAACFRKDLFSAQGGLFLANMCCMMTIALSITYLVSELCSNVRAMDMIANIIGLGMGFLCGIFVPMEFLGDTVIKVAHFLPGYWYALACKEIEKYGNAMDSHKLLLYMGVEILFAIAFICAGRLAASVRYKKQKTVS